MTRPNILFFFTDDQRFDTLAALGNPHIITPNFDRLVARGTAFTHAHIPGGTSGAVCMPSRAMLHTGRSLFHLDGAGQSIPAEHAMLGECLRGWGYQTYGSGKWHNGRDSFARSFSAGAEIFFGGMTDHWNVPAYDYDPTGRYQGKCPQVLDPFLSKQETYRDCDHISAGTHSSELIANAALDYLGARSGTAADSPFFMYLAFLAPHDPRVMPQKYRDLYRDREVPLPDAFMPQHPFDAGVHQIRDEVLAAYPRQEEETRQHLVDYYAMITHLDDQIGRVLQGLEESGEAQNTIVVLAGDNGLAVGKHGLFGKQNLYDHSVRVPLVMAGPGIESGGRCDTFAYLFDIFPTLCQLIGEEAPDSVEGKSLLGAMRQGEPGRDEVYLAYERLHRGLRDRRHKLIEYQIGGRRHTQLFDLEADPDELHDLSGQPAAGQVLADMRRRLARCRDAWDDRQTPWGETFWGGMEY
jgi:arylsulfatase A-like enzyme